MKVRGKWFPLMLSATVFPGAGQWYLGRRWRGGMIMGLTLVATLGLISRYFAVFFALLQKRGPLQAPQWNPLPMMVQTWKVDHRVLSTFLIAIAALWLLSVVDLILTPKEGTHS